MDFETNYKNRWIYMLIYIEVKNNKMLFNSKDWVAIASLISNSKSL